MQTIALAVWFLLYGVLGLVPSTKLPDWILPLGALLVFVALIASIVPWRKGGP